jgi:hypothetical protein
VDKDTRRGVEEQSGRETEHSMALFVVVSDGMLAGRLMRTTGCVVASSLSVPKPLDPP